MTTLTFPGQVPFTDPTVPAGGCELGAGRCVMAAELEITVPAIGSVRLLCRDHAGYYMLAAAGPSRRTHVRVRALTTNSGKTERERP